MKRILSLCLLAGLLLGLAGCAAPAQPTQPVTIPTTQPTTLPTQPTEPPVTKLSTATIGATGDILLHDLVIQSGLDSETNTYNYDNIFKYFKNYAGKMDWAAANLEVTLCGDDNGFAYKGYPCFNAPDAIVDALKAAGFDTLLTANNHSYDTGHTGFHRTQQTILDRELTYIGTRQEEEKPNYLIQNVNGINIGMICYTYNTSQDSDGKVALNGIPLSAADSRLINSFSYSKLDSFYEKLAGELAQMKENGAEATVLFIHWGDEYQSYPNSTQKKIAQQLCNLGIDVIVGNHAHVVQPVSLLTSESDPNRKTVCLYSTGNAVANIYYIEGKFPVETEDGVLFQVTFAKYSDGTVLVEKADVLPTWIHRYWDDDLGKRMYTILPLSHEKEIWQSELSLTDSLLSKCENSYNRTMGLVGEGLNEANAWYAQNQQAVELALGVQK